jgi:Leucine-rich repeat (LRR) protein
MSNIIDERISKALYSNQEFLNLFNYGFPELPAEIGDLSHLQTLIIRTHWLESIPPEIGKLSNLRFLEIGAARLDYMYFRPWYPLSILPPEIGKLSKLETLILEINILKTLPPEIGSLKNLQTLRLNQNTITQYHPKNLG